MFRLVVGLPHEIEGYSKIKCRAVYQVLLRTYLYSNLFPYNFVLPEDAFIPAETCSCDWVFIIKSCLINIYW